MKREMVRKTRSSYTKEIVSEEKTKAKVSAEEQKKQMWEKSQIRSNKDSHAAYHLTSPVSAIFEICWLAAYRTNQLTGSYAGI